MGAVKDLALSAYPDLVRGGILVNLKESIVVGHIAISLLVVVSASALVATLRVCVLSYQLEHARS